MDSMNDILLFVLHHSVFLLLLTQSGRGESQMIGPTQPVVAMIGDDIILPCHLEPAKDVGHMTVEWSKQALTPKSVHVSRDGVELLTEQNPSYLRRTSLFTNKLQCGDISLKLSKVTPSDAGTYKCLVPSLNAESVIELAVGSVFSPAIEITKVKNKVVLECKSNGWYPEPQILWLSSDGNLISADSTTNNKGSDGLHTVSSKVTVAKAQDYRFTCRVQQNKINQTKEAHIHLSGDLFMVQSDLAVRITVCMAVCLIAIGIAVLLIWKSGQTKTKPKKYGEDQIREEKEQVRGSNKKDKLNDDLQKAEEDLKHAKEVISEFMEQKKHLKSHRDIINSRLQEVNTQIKEIQKKIDTTSKLSNDKKHRREKIKTELVKSKEECKKLLENTEKLMENTEDIIMKMTERKGKLEKDKEQIKKHLKETKKESEDLLETNCAESFRERQEKQ